MYLKRQETQKQKSERAKEQKSDFPTLFKGIVSTRMGRLIKGNSEAVSLKCYDIKFFIKFNVMFLNYVYYVLYA